MNTVKVFFAGDFCSKASTSLITISEDLESLIRSCDLRVVNFEVPLKPDANMPRQQRERFFQNEDAPVFLQNLGFNLFSLANNHAFDWGEEGYKKTKKVLGESSFGAGTYDEAYSVKVVEVNGLKLGFIGLCFAAYTGVFDDATKKNGLGCAYINDLRVNHLILEAKRSVDYLFIVPHDGIEYIDVPLPETVARYRDFIDFGADAVIASHPHCPQGWEEYKGKPIFYSLGNFLFNSKEGYDYRATNRPHWYEGLCVIITINGDTLSWDVINSRNVENIRIELDKDKGRDDYNEYLCRFLTDMESYENHLIPILEKKSVNYLNIIGGIFRPHKIKDALKSVFSCIRGKKPVAKEELSYLIKNDLKREILTCFSQLPSDNK